MIKERHSTKDTTEFISLINKHKGIIYSVIKKYKNIIPESFKEDAYQEVCLKVWDTFYKYEQKEYCDFSSWLWKTAEWAIFQFHRKWKRWECLSLFDDVSPDDYSYIPYDEAHINGLHRAIKCLDDEERSIFCLMLEGRQVDEISKITGLSKSSISHKVQRCYEQIRVNASLYFDVVPKNYKHGYENHRGNNNPLSHPIIQLSLCGNTVREFSSAGDAHRNGFDGRRVMEAVKGKRRSYKGYHWRFLEDLKTA